MRAFALLVSMASLVTAAEWPQFRGPAASGVSDGKPPLKFSPTLNVKWKVPVISGMSSPVLSGGKIFLTGFDGGKLYTLAFDEKTGAELWRKEAPAKQIEAYHKTESSPAASTCCTDGKTVISYFGSCGLHAYDLDGKPLWTYEMPMAVTGFDFGTGVSPIIADGLVILARDLAKDSKILAIDLKTGSRVWEKAREKFGSGWSTPTVWNGQVVLPGYGRMVAYDLKTGEEVWSHVGMPSACCTTPVIAEGLLLYAGWSPGDDFKLPSFDEFLKTADKDSDGAISKEEGENSFMKGFFDNNDVNKDGKITRDEWKAMEAYMAQGKNSAFAVKPGAKGTLTEKDLAWKNTNKKALPYVPSAVAYDGMYYIVKDGGLMTAIEIKTGKELYAAENAAQAGRYYASPLAANGHIYCLSLAGDVTVIKAGESPDVVHKAKLGETTAATPAIGDDVIYIRTAKHLYAFAEKK